MKQALDKDRKDLETESGSLRSQLQSHADSIKILVAEKADFEATVRKLHSELANKSGKKCFYKVKLCIKSISDMNLC